MPRPKTDAADYERFPARLPKDVMQALRRSAAKAGRPINTELVRILRRALRVPAKDEQEPSALLRQAS